MDDPCPTVRSKVPAAYPPVSGPSPPHCIENNTNSLSRSDEGFAGELKRCQVGNSNNVSTSRGVEHDVQRVEHTIVCENLILLLEVIGPVQELHLSIELTCVRVQQDLNRVNGSIKVDRVHGASLNVSSGVGGEEVSALGGHLGAGVGGSGVEGEVSRSGVVDIDGGGLVTSSDQGLDGTHHTILGVRLDLHGSPVGPDPQFDEGLDGAAIGVNADLYDFLVGIGEFPVLT